jgi:hypothetical protein
MTGLGIGMTVIDIIAAAWAAAPINIITIACGLYLALAVGPRAIRTAADHKAFMDEHREKMRKLGAPWN